MVWTLDRHVIFQSDGTADAKHFPKPYYVNVTLKLVYFKHIIHYNLEQMHFYAFVVKLRVVCMYLFALCYWYITKKPH